MKNITMIFFLSLYSLGSFAKGLPSCAENSKESGDVNLYWQVAQGQSTNDDFEDICTISVLAIRPTQFAVGLYEVKIKSDNLKNLNEKKLDNYLQKNPEPIVIGPHGEFFIIDHHHLARALYESNIKSTYGIILENWYNSKEEKFWNHMKEKNWLYLVNQKGEKKTVDDLLKISSVKDLKDDPYRSLAGETRCKTESKCNDGQWLKKSIPFIEFLWAEHFRKIPVIAQTLKQYGENDFKKVIDAATAEVKRLKGILPESETQFNN